jgi:hypothetical protein
MKGGLLLAQNLDAAANRGLLRLQTPKLSRSQGHLVHHDAHLPHDPFLLRALPFDLRGKQVCFLSQLGYLLLLLEVKLLSPWVQVSEKAFLEGHIGLQELALEILEFRVLFNV